MKFQSVDFTRVHILTLLAMFENVFIKNPVSVVIYDPMTGKNTQTVIFVGDVPAVVSKALKSYVIVNSESNHRKITKSEIKSCSIAVNTISEFYGAGWKRKLGLTRLNSKIKIGGDEETDDAQDDELFDASPIDDSGELNLNDIDELLGNTPDADSPDSETGLSSRPGKYLSRKTFGGAQFVINTTVHIYPSDTIIDLRFKIASFLNIPIYRQHIHWLENGRYKTSYILSIDSQVYPNVTKIREHLNDDEYGNFDGIPTNRYMYNNRDQIRVESRDTFIILDDLVCWDKKIYVSDLNEVLSSTEINLREFSSDPYMSNLLYWGFVILYWPIITYEIFETYCDSEIMIRDKFPDISPDPEDKKLAISRENSTSDSMYKLFPKVISSVSEAKLSTSVLRSRVGLKSQDSKDVNIRGIFDMFRISRNYPEIRGFITHDRQKYMLEKFLTRHDRRIRFPNLKNGLIIAICTKDSCGSEASTFDVEMTELAYFNLFDDGRYQLIINFAEEDNKTLESVLKIAEKTTKPLIELINNYIKIMNGETVSVLTAQNSDFLSVSAQVSWQKVMSTASFKYLEKMWNLKHSPNISIKRTASRADYFEFKFCKGVSGYDHSVVDRVIASVRHANINNSYKYLSDSQIKQKWDSQLTGRLVRVYHRTTSVTFIIFGAKPYEFDLFQKYITVFMTTLTCSREFASIESRSRDRSADNKKISRLREIDPELFNLRKHGSVEVYSRICQSKQQPVVYTEDEIKEMPKGRQNALLKYWNFTLNKPAYYGCPNKNYPHLSFKVGQHPKNYCLPCCGKIMSHSAKKKKIFASCLNNATYSDNVDTDIWVQHITKFGKHIEPGRLAYLPTGSLTPLLEASIEKNGYDYLVKGVNQTMPSAENIGLLSSIADARGSTTTDLINELTNLINNKTFPRLINGKFSKIFNSAEESRDAIKTIFTSKTHNPVTSVYFKNWKKLFTELAEIWGVNILFISYKLSGETRLRTSQRLSEKLRNKSAHDVIIIIESGKYHHPVYLFDKREKNSNAVKKIFDSSDPIMKTIFDIFSYNPELSEIQMKKTKLSKIGAKIQSKYIGLSNKIHGLLFAVEDKKLFIPINMQHNIDIREGKKEVPETYNIFRRSGINLDIDLLADALDTLNPNIHSIIRGKEGNYYALRDSDGLVYYFNDSSEIPKRVKELYPKIREVQQIYDIEDINAAIFADAKKVENNGDKILPKSLYKNFVYELFIINFSKFIQKERNSAIRNKILESIKNTNFISGMDSFYEFLNKILADFPSDITAMKKHVDDFYYGDMNKDTLVDKIKNSKFDFDSTTIIKIRNAKEKDAKLYLAGLTRQIAANGTIQDNSFPNILSPCSGDLGFCMEDKLIIDENILGYGLDELNDLLYNNITNPLIGNNITNANVINRYVEFFDFEDHPSEKIAINKIVNPPGK